MLRWTPSVCLSLTKNIYFYRTDHVYISLLLLQTKVQITTTNVEGEATLRRREPNRGGPRVTRNITETEVMNQIHEICSNGHPFDKYNKDIELGKILTTQ